MPRIENIRRVSSVPPEETEKSKKTLLSILIKQIPKATKGKSSSQYQKNRVAKIDSGGEFS
jgi:hypothetical protein